LLRNTGGYSFLTRSNGTRDNITGKVDYILSPKNVFTGTYIWNRDIPDRADATNDYSTVPKVTNNVTANLLSATWRWNPAPAITNELRGGFNLAPALFDTSENFGSYQLAAAGLLFSNPENTFLPQGRNTNTYHFADNASYTRGRHNIQFGFQVQNIRINFYDAAGTLPVYTLGISSGNTNGLTASQLPGISASDLTSANNLLANLAGYVSSYTQNFNVTSRTSGFVNGARNNVNFRFNNYAGYAQDNWKILPG